MKYEMIFGNQDLFDGAPKDAVIAIKRPFISGVRSEELHFFSSTFDAVMMAGSSFNFNNVILKTAEYAERRIIAEPVWTMADKLAGRLPEVGCKAVKIQGFCEVDVLMIHNGCVVVCNSGISDSRPAVFEIDSFMELFTPLETPAEKAARLKSEWCAKAAKQLKNLEYTSTLTSIYDALLSGELQAPKGE